MLKVVVAVVVSYHFDFFVMCDNINVLAPLITLHAASSSQAPCLGSVNQDSAAGRDVDSYFEIE